MKWFGLSLVLASALLLVSAVPVAADGKPTRVFLPAGTVTTTAGQVCPFALQQEVLVNQEYGIIFTDAAGQPTHIIITGRFVVRLTNLDSGNSMVLNASGPGTLTFNADGTLTLDAQGPATALLLASDAGGPSAFYDEGRAIVVIGATGIVSRVFVGHEVDLCAALA